MNALGTFGHGARAVPMTRCGYMRRLVNQARAYDYKTTSISLKGTLSTFLL